MIAAALVLATASALMFAVNRLAKWLEGGRTTLDTLTATPRLHEEWPRLQAAVDQARADIAAEETKEGTPLYDRMVCEQIEKAEGWAS